MTNTQKRVVSGLTLIALVGLSLFLGTSAVLILILIIGMICVDEVFCHFLGLKRNAIMYFVNQATFALPFIYFNFFNFSPGLMSVFVNAGMVLNFLLIFYVFKMKMQSDIMATISKQYNYTVGCFFLLPLMSLASLLHYGKWHYLVSILLFVNFGMDIGAWFVGRKFGKRKLWPSVSPNKTIEGLLGGIFFSATLGGLLWWAFFDKFSIIYPILFGCIGALSQLGDLVESKLKRQSHIKDSSNLIPGHGGFYDRVDSLVFVSPFFATMLRYIYF